MKIFVAHPQEGYIEISIHDVIPPPPASPGKVNE